MITLMGKQTACAKCTIRLKCRRRFFLKIRKRKKILENCLLAGIKMRVITGVAKKGFFSYIYAISRSTKSKLLEKLWRLFVT